MNKLDTAILKHIKKLVLEDHKPVSYRDLLYFIVDNEPYELNSGTIRNKLLQFKKEKRIKYITEVKLLSILCLELNLEKIN